MPQVYLALRDDASNYLIARKRLQNRWWQGVLANPRTVNQAGQWALPGGRMNPNEPPASAALREFLEETGVNLQDAQIGLERGKTILFTSGPFKVIEFEVSPTRLREIRERTNANVQPSTRDPRIPADANVFDWELQSTLIVYATELPNYLGVRQALPGWIGSIVANQRWDTQAIEWYAHIANTLRHRGHPEG